MPRGKPWRPYPVEPDESSWEQALWRPQRTFGPVLELIESIARDYGRQQLMDELVPSPLDIHVPFKVDARGKVAFGDIQTSDRRAVVLTYTVHRIMRELLGHEAARIIRQVDIRDESGTSRRRIVVRWDRRPPSMAAQIRRLLRAVEAGSQFKIETAWFGLTPLTEKFLREVGIGVARRMGTLAGYNGEYEVPATLVPVPMIAPGLLRLILPYAVLAVSRPGRRPVHARDEALAKIFDIFVEVSGHVGTGARRGDHDEPSGPGAEFVRRIETIFGVQLMPKASTHAIPRAAKRMRRRS